MKVLFWAVLVALPMTSCLRMTLTMTNLLEIGGCSILSLMRSVPLDCLHLPRLLAFDFPFPGIKEAYLDRITKDKAQKLVSTFIGFPETHEVLFNIIVVIDQPNLLDELLKYPHLYTPKAFSRGEVRKLTVDQLVHLRDVFFTFARGASSSPHPLHFAALLDNCISVMTIEDDLRHEGTTEERFILNIELIDLAYAGFKTSPSNIQNPVETGMSDFINPIRMSNGGTLTAAVSLDCYSRLVSNLKSFIPNDPGRLAYWWAKLMLQVLTLQARTRTVHGYTKAFLEQYFTEASYWLAPPSLIDALLESAFRNEIEFSRGTKVKLEDYFITLHHEHPSRPYYGSSGEVALNAWRNRLSFLYRHDPLLPISIADHEDFMHYYGKFTDPISTKINVAMNLPAPIEIGRKLCRTHTCFLEHAQILLSQILEDISTSQGVTILAKGDIMKIRAIVRLLLTLLANNKYDPNSLPVRIITSIIDSTEDSQGMTFLRQLIQESYFLEYLEILYRNADHSWFLW